MARFILVLAVILLNTWASAQSFEMNSLQDTYKGHIGEVVKAPIIFKNTTEKPITLVVHKIQEQIGKTQKNFYCLDNNCLDQKTEDFTLKIEPGQSLNGFQIALEGGLVSGTSLVKYVVFNRTNPGHSIEFDLNFQIEEAEKKSIYESRQILLHDVYPNPSTEYAFVNY